MATRQNTSDVERSTAELRHQIEDTRRRIDRTLGEIEHRLQGRRLIDKAEAMLRDQAARSRAVQTIREHPVPAVMSALGLAGAAAGITYLVAESGDGHVKRHEGPSLIDKAKERFHQAGDKLKGMASHTPHRFHLESGRCEPDKSSATEGLHDIRQRGREKVSHAKDVAKNKIHAAEDKVHDVKNRLWGAYEEHPLAAAAAALAAGIILGELLPSTRAEDEVMGPASDRVAEDAKRAGESLLDRGAETAKAAVSAAQQEAEQQQGRPLSEQIGAIGESAAAAAGESAQQQNLTSEGVQEEAERRFGME